MAAGPAPRAAGKKDRGEVDANGEEKMSSGLRSGLVSGTPNTAVCNRHWQMGNTQ